MRASSIAPAHRLVNIQQPRQGEQEGREKMKGEEAGQREEIPLHTILLLLLRKPYFVHTQGTMRQKKLHEAGGERDGEKAQYGHSTSL